MAAKSLLTLEQEAWMNIHKNARLTLSSRGPGQASGSRRAAQAAWPAGSRSRVRTARKWLARYRAEGVPGFAGPLQPAARQSRPDHGPGHPARRSKCFGSSAGRARRSPGPWAISAATAARILRRRAGLSRRGRLEPPPAGAPLRACAPRRSAAPRHQEAGADRRSRAPHHGPAGRGYAPRQWVGDRLHIAVDDHSRVAYVELLPDEHGDTARGFVRRALGGSASRACGSGGC